MNQDRLKNACDAFFDTQVEFIKIKVQLERFLSPVLAELGINSVQAAVLNLIEKNGQMTVTELFRTLDFNQGNMSSLCKKLEGDGFVKKTKSDCDERKSYLSLTEKGRASLLTLQNAIAFRPSEGWLSREEIEKAESALLTLQSIIGKVNEKFLQHTDKEKGDDNAQA